MNEDIDRRLREAAEAHRPDRARMLARVERGMAGPAVRHRARPFARSGTRIALAGLAAGGILTTGGLAVAAIVANPPLPTLTTPATLAPAVSSPPPTSARPTPGTPHPATTPGGSRPTPSATGPAPSPTADESRNGPLRSAGSVDPKSTVYWTQSDLLLETTQPLTALTVEIRIVQAGGAKSTGTWQTLPGDDFTVTVQEAGGALVYRWVLKPGRTVPVGNHEFAAQFNNGADGAHSGAGDGYRVDAQGAGGSASVRGGFAPTR
ncbi:hypothetical protein [Streptomyces sp. 351MFTsu5.1]|uniref:hypothetical protein n=1 Tax=Streptomyces sp. 351MFTsu5.1 TaxID=1172180 RepID=UPI000378878C|nr:hypothetical protein [Streptomyces sp. 351MFTsu5.1]